MLTKLWDFVHSPRQKLRCFYCNQYSIVEDVPRRISTSWTWHCNLCGSDNRLDAVRDLVDLYGLFAIRLKPKQTAVFFLIEWRHCGLYPRGGESAAALQ